MIAKIYPTVQDFINNDFQSLKENSHCECGQPHPKPRPNKFYVTSGGFDPLHIDHVRCLRKTFELAAHKYYQLGQKYSVIVIVNGDGFLERKKTKAFMPLAERMEIIAHLEGIDYVMGWDDGSQTVVGALELLQPAFFTKGGDRSAADKVPEAEVCDKIGCQILYGIGGTEKIQSSSHLIEKSNGNLIKQSNGEKL